MVINTHVALLQNAHFFLCEDELVREYMLVRLKNIDDEIQRGTIIPIPVLREISVELVHCMHECDAILSFLSDRSLISNLLEKTYTTKLYKLIDDSLAFASITDERGFLSSDTCDSARDIITNYFSIIDKFHEYTKHIIGNVRSQQSTVSDQPNQLEQMNEKLHQMMIFCIRSELDALVSNVRIADLEEDIIDHKFFPGLKKLFEHLTDIIRMVIKYSLFGQQKSPCEIELIPRIHTLVTNIGVMLEETSSTNTVEHLCMVFTLFHFVVYKH